MIKIEVLDKNFIFQGEVTKLESEIDQMSLFEIFLKKLSDEDGYSDPGIVNMRDSCNAIANFVDSGHDVGDELVSVGIVGNVQSGKTGSMIGNCCKFIDNDKFINVIIVLAGTSGTKTSLYKQTHNRFSSLFKTENAIKFKYLLIPNSHTNTSNELIQKYDRTETQIDHTITSGKNFVYIVMKEIQHLKTIKREIEKIGSCISNTTHSGRKFRIVFFDDECDDSSIEVNDSKIPQLIYDIMSISNFDTRLYVGYTATPAAKQLEKEQNKLKIDKYFTLRYPTTIDENPAFNYKVPSLRESYTGSDFYYNSNYQLIKSYENEEEHDLINSLSYYLVSAFLFRKLFPNKKAQMLFHESGKIAEHSNIENQIKKHLNLEPMLFQNIFKDDLLTKIYHEYISSIEKLDRSMLDTILKYNENFKSLYSSSFDDLYEIYKDIELLVLNSENKYEIGVTKKHTINIGGNIMSRGVTFDNLVTSVFLRLPSSDDTLSQMQRWFGYRGHYLPLCRVITTKQILAKLIDINSNFKTNIVNLNDIKKQNSVPIVTRNAKPTGKIRRNDLIVKNELSDIFIVLENDYRGEIYEILPKKDNTMKLSSFPILDTNISNAGNFNSTIKNLINSNEDLELNYRIVESESSQISTWGTHLYNGGITLDRFYTTPDDFDYKNKCLITVYQRKNKPLLIAFRPPLAIKNPISLVNIESLANK
jgi:hypothetical protein